MSPRSSGLGRATGAGLIALGFVVAGCAAPSEQTSGDSPVVVHGSSDLRGYHGNYLDPPYEMPRLTFTDTSGRRFDLVWDTDKPLTLVFFGYTNCPDLCPVVLADVASALRRMPAEQRDQIQLVFITTDPRRDTQTAIRDYLDRFDESFVGLTADLDVIRKAAKQLDVQIEPRGQGSVEGYTVDHGTHVIAFGPNDKGHLLWTPGTPVADLRHDYTRLLTANP